MFARMRFKKSQFIFICIVFLCVLEVALSKRAIGLSGRGRGGSKSSPFGRRKSSSSSNDSPSSAAKPVAAPAAPPKHEVKANKPSAPHETSVNKETSHGQQSSHNQGYNSPNQNQAQPPIGWNVPGHNSLSAGGVHSPQSGATGGFRSGYQTQGSPPAYSPAGGHHPHFAGAAPPAYGGNHLGAPPSYPSYGGVPSPNTGAAGGFRSGYQTHGAPPAYSPAGGHQPHFAGAAPPSYGGHPTYGAPPAYSAHGQNYGGFGQGGYHGGHPQQSWGGGYQSPGMMGGMGGMGMGMGGMGMGGMGGGGFGHGHMGGYGGGFGSPMGGGYGMQKSGGLFSGSTVRNLLIGYVAYKAISGVGSLMFHRPYSVYNYYNMPPDMKVPEKIELPSNILTLCDANVTNFCASETIAVCTSNGTIICAATMDQRRPCQDNSTMLCVNTTLSCTDANDSLCQNSTQKDQLKAVVDMPCLTNLTLDVNLLDKQSSTPNTNYVYCVTSMAIAGPNYKVCPDLGDSTNDYRSVLNENYEWWLEQDGFRKNYTVYNYKHPMEAKGDINMPIHVLTNCSTNASKLCAPNTTHICTTFNEVMCLAAISETSECEDEDDTVCIGTTIPCTQVEEDHLCDNKTEGEKFIEFDLPCFVNITLNAPIGNFVLSEFNGTLPVQIHNSSYSYQYNYCVITLALPSVENDICITEELKKLHDEKKNN